MKRNFVSYSFYTQRKNLKTYFHHMQNCSRCCLICVDILSQLVVPAHVSLKIVSSYHCLLRLELTCGTSSQDLIPMGQTGVF